MGLQPYNTKAWLYYYLDTPITPPEENSKRRALAPGTLATGGGTRKPRSSSGPASNMSLPAFGPSTKTSACARGPQETQRASFFFPVDSDSAPAAQIGRGPTSWWCGSFHTAGRRCPFAGPLFDFYYDGRWLNPVLSGARLVRYRAKPQATIRWVDQSIAGAQSAHSVAA